MLKLFWILLITSTLYAQEMESNSITIESSSTVYVVADILYFDIKISVDDPDPQKVFDDHKSQEQKLIRLLNEFSVPDSSIQYSLLTIRKSNPRSGDKNFSSSQQIKVVFQGISKYQDFQIKLLSNGFYEFRSRFGSSQVEKARKDGYTSALKNAKRDAEIIAESLGKEVGEIIEISTRTNEFRNLDLSVSLKTANVHSLIDIEQSVATRTNLTVKFRLK
ncbi:MAG: SIMPL domain-containing protein [Calditrichaceae bacterium]